jgi:nucleoside-diphosphate-sugar epimerase
VNAPESRSRALDAWHAPYEGARALVVGGTGFLGRHVAAALAANGAELHWTTRDPSLVEPRALGLAAGRGHVVDLRDDLAVIELLTAVRPAITFNLAGYGIDPGERDEREAALLNDHFVGVLAQALGQGVAQARAPVSEGSETSDRNPLDPPLLDLVHVGSALEYGKAGGDLRESSEPQPTTVYGRTKLAGTRALEQACRNSPLRVVTARLFMVFGPGEHEGRLVPSLRRTAATSAPLDLTSGRQERDFTWVGDVAEALLRLGVARGVRPGEIVNVATGRSTSVRAFVATAARIFAIPRELLRFGTLPTRPEEMRHSPVAIGRAKELLHWFPSTTIEQGLRKIAAAR